MLRVACLLGCIMLFGCPRDISVLPVTSPDATQLLLDASTDASGVEAGTDAGDGGAGAPDVEARDADEATDASCVSDCRDRGCGADPVCGQLCGHCAPGQSCSLSYQCVTSCLAGSSTCAGDGFGFLACGHNALLGVDDLGPRVACAPSVACDAVQGRCAPSGCQSGEVLFLLDRSSSMGLNTSWLWVKEALLGTIATREHGSRFGLRQFPLGSCSAGPIMAPSVASGAGIAAAFLEPGSEASSPIGAALDGVEASFSPRRDGQAVVLVTDGEETCGSALGVIRQASTLFRSGLRVYVVAVSTVADQTFLDRVAEAGGTQHSRLVTGSSQLQAELGAILEELNACANPAQVLTAGFYHTCRLNADRTLTCWGRNLNGEAIAPSGSYRDVSAGTGHTCAVRSGGEVDCWGRDDDFQLAAPTGVFAHVTSGGSHSCALRLDGTAACWGRNDSGQARPPAGVFRELAAGGFFTCGLRADSSIECWGSTPSWPREPVHGLSGGSFHLCAIRDSDLSLDCPAFSEPSPAGAFLKVAAGFEHNCAIRADQTLVCWGSNFRGSAEPPSGRFLDITVNNTHSCAVRDDFVTLCWGYGGDGQATPP